MNVETSLEYRNETPRWLGWAVPVLTVLAALTVGALPILLAQTDPITVYLTMFLDPLTSDYRTGQILTRATPLILAGLAVYLPLKAGLWNVGAEGQIYVGGIGAAVVALTVDAGIVVLLPLTLLAGALLGALWGFVPGYLLARWNANEIVTTLMLVFVAQNLNSYMIRSVLPGPSNYPYTETFPDTAVLPPLAESGILSHVHAGVLFVPIAAAAVYVIMDRTAFGFETTVFGSSQAAAEQSGMSRFKIIVVTMTIGGLLAGAAGVSQAAGTGGRLSEAISPGYGFTAIIIALLGRRGVPQVLAAGAFFALIYVGGNAVSTSTGLSTAIIDVVQALIFLFLITGEFFKRFTVDVRVTRDTAEVV